MKLTAAHVGENHEITVKRDGEILQARVDEANYELSVHFVDDGVYLLTHEGNVFECFVEKDLSRQNTFRVHVKNREFVTTVFDPRRLGSNHRSSVAAEGGSAKITSPMAGKVVRVLVKTGEHVKAGDGVVVVEAMKMQNELKSPCDGVVTEIRAVENAAVDARDVLAVIEAVKD